MQNLHTVARSLAERSGVSPRQVRKANRGRSLAGPRANLALKLQIRLSMKSNMHNVVRQLLELHDLEEQLEEGSGQPEEISRAELRIESLRANLPVGVLLTHDHMRAKGKRSVAVVRQLVCSGCHLTLGVGNVAALRRGEIQRCGHCGRYVYLPDGDVPEEAPPAWEWKPPARRKRREVSPRH